MKDLGLEIVNCLKAIVKAFILEFLKWKNSNKNP